MKKTMFVLSIVFAAGTVISAVLYHFARWSPFLSIAISLGTCAYHFIMRLLVGSIYNALMKNKGRYDRPWYQQHNWERQLYRRIHVKAWKKHMPSYEPSLFDPAIHTWAEIAGAMCQAELVHETIVIFSFLPIFAGRWFGAWPVFVTTSVIAALIDLSFVVMQRYNRPRVVTMIRKDIERSRKGIVI